MLENLRICSSKNQILTKVQDINKINSADKRNVNTYSTFTGGRIIVFTV